MKTLVLSTMGVVLVLGAGLLAALALPPGAQHLTVHVLDLLVPK